MTFLKKYILTNKFKEEILRQILNLIFEPAVTGYPLTPYTLSLGIEAREG